MRWHWLLHKLTYPGHLDWPWPSPWNGPFDQVAVDVCRDTTSVRRFRPVRFHLHHGDRQVYLLPSVQGTRHSFCHAALHLKAGTHQPCSRAVNTGHIYGPWTRLSFWTPVLQVENNYDVINNSACRSRWPVFTGVHNDTREHGPWTRVVCTGVSALYSMVYSHPSVCWYLFVCLWRSCACLYRGTYR